MTPPEIRFEDGSGYERYMGAWSQLVGSEFLAWLNPDRDWRWLDVGCGNGAFTELIVERCHPASVDGVDPAEGQLVFARTRPAARVARFHQGDAMALPFPDRSFDAAVMPLVIFFVPDPAGGVGEMARVVAAGGSVSAYAWDMPGGGFPYAVLQHEMRELGVDVPVPPHAEASTISALQELWTGSGLGSVEVRELTVERTFDDFADYWAAIFKGPSVGPQLAAMPAASLSLLEARMRAHFPPDSAGRVTCSARANAVKGRVIG